MVRRPVRTRGGSEDAEAELPDLPSPRFAGRGEHLRPRDQLADKGDEFAPHPVLREAAQGQLPQAGRGARRMRSSARARRRWRSSRSASCPPAVFVTKQTQRLPSTSVIHNCAPGYGRSLHTITRTPLGHPVRSTVSVTSATHAPSRALTRKTVGVAGGCPRRLGSVGGGVGRPCGDRRSAVDHGVGPAMGCSLGCTVAPCRDVVRPRASLSSSGSQAGCGVPGSTGIQSAIDRLQPLKKWFTLNPRV